MRLLHVEADGEFSLVEFVGKDIPRYAILSHTWGADDEEVTFKDLIEGTGQDKTGYRKLTFCSKQALYDNLSFFWIDTCCIDKSSSAELSEAINSMFRWYQAAVKCYVYLSDVSITSLGGNNQSLQKSKWFTRGWTLQELIAPTYVDFFSLEGEQIGDKSSMVQEIQQITGIPVSALQGRPLSQFGVDERLSWTEKRETKREEDAAYCLLGLFDIHMPLIYGEGREKAKARLQNKINKNSHAQLSALSSQSLFMEPSSRDHASSSSAVPHGRGSDSIEQSNITTLINTCESVLEQLKTHDGTDILSLPEEKTRDESQGLISTFVKDGSGGVFPNRGNYSSHVEMVQSALQIIYSVAPSTDARLLFQHSTVLDNYINGRVTLCNYGDLLTLSVGQIMNQGEYANAQESLQFLLDILREVTLRSQRAVDDWLHVRTFHERYNVTQYYDKQISSRLEGTCNWVFSHHAYRSWISESYTEKAARILWICAPAGYGKTVLCARLIEHLREMQSIPVVYFFASPHAQSGGEPSFIIRSWISQLARLDPDVLELVQRHSEVGQRASESTVWSLFGSIVSKNRHYIFVLDGFDEYSRLDDRRTEFLQKLKEATKRSISRVLITSRDETDIKAELSPSEPLDVGNVMLRCKISIEDVRHDISHFSRSVVDKKLPNKDDGLRKDLAEQLAEKCGGMFLWIKLQQDQLRSSKNLKQLQNIVRNMPIGLNKTYERNWQVIQTQSPEEQSRALAILRWSTFALRPLSVSEITEALVVELGDDGTALQWDELPDNIDDDYINNEIVDICGALVEVRSGTSGGGAGYRTIHLIHPSVREFLLFTLSHNPVNTSQLHFGIGKTPEQAEHHEYLAKICLGYLSCKDVWQQPTTQKAAEHRYKFISYAANNWHSHVIAAGESSQEMLRLVKEFLSPKNEGFTQWREYIESPDWTLDSEQEENYNTATPLYYAALLNLPTSMEYIWREDKTQLNKVGGEFGTPLQAVCFRGHDSAFKLLVGWGADPDIKGGIYCVPINAAIAGRNRSMVKDLIQMGVSYTIQDSMGQTPLYIAAKSGDYDAVCWLIEAGAELTTVNKYGLTPLHPAASYGHLEVVKLLLEKGADLTVADDEGNTPLVSAASSGHFEIVELLLEKGAIITVTNENGWTPLISAASSGHLEIVRLLLEKGADLTAVNENGWTPLGLAANYGHSEVVKLLLEKGADLTVADKEGWKPLNAAASLGHLGTVKLLLEKGADIMSTNNSGWTSLNLAASHGQLKTVEFLLEKGVDAEASSVDNWTPVLSAACNGHLEVVKLLLEKGADMTAVNKYGWTALNLAAGNNRLEVAKFLLEKGADIAIGNNDGSTPLIIASKKGHLGVVTLLLERGADPTVADERAWTPLDAAAHYDHIEVVQLLVNSGINVNGLDSPYGTVLGLLAFKGYTEILKTAYQRYGGNTQLIDSHGRTPLHLAIRGGHLDTVLYLISLGVGPTTEDAKGDGLLSYASSGGSLEVLSAVLREYPKSLAQTKNWSRLHWACKSGNPEIVKKLIDEGYRSECVTVSQPQSSWDPASIAIFHGHEKMLEELPASYRSLLSAGADVVQSVGKLHGDSWCDGCFHVSQ